MAKFFLLFVSLFFLPLPLFAATDIVINEIAWMGTKTSSSDEWLELANLSDLPQDISGWKLETLDKGIAVELKGTIPARGFFLLERTDDTTVPGMSADQIFSGSFSNTSEVVVLKDTTGNIVDTVDAARGWPAGDNTSKDTMQRSGGTWISAAGTPKIANATAPTPQNKPAQTAPTSVITPTSTQPTQQSQTQPQPLVNVQAHYPATFYISEFFPDPKGADDQGEWIELYNDSEQQESLAGFFLDDAQKGSHPYQIPAGTLIPAKGYSVFTRKVTGIALNNKDDQVRLLYPNKQVAAQVSYTQAKEGQAAAYDRVKNKVFWTSKPTPGQANNIPSLIKLANTSKPIYQQSEIKTINSLPNASLTTQKKANNQTASALPLKEQGSLSDFWAILISLGLGGAAMFGYLRFFKKTTLIMLLGVISLVIPFMARADAFPVLNELDLLKRAQVDAQLVRSGSHSLIYVEKGISISLAAVQDLGMVFDSTIYPRLTDLFGSPFEPGVNNDQVTILFTSIDTQEGGYFISSQPSTIYVNASFLDTSSRVKEIVAHELQHLIAYTQKDRRLKTSEARWINEMRSEYASTYANVGTRFLAERAKEFKKQPYDNIFDWHDDVSDYGYISMLAHYLAARFGDAFYRQEVRTDRVDRASIEQTLKQIDPALTFAKVFSEWRLTNYINDSSILNGKYSYKNSIINARLKADASTSYNAAPESQIITTNVSSSNSGAVAFYFNGTRSKVTFATPDRSADLVVTYLKQSQDGTFFDGQATMEHGTADIMIGSDIHAAIFSMSNLSDTVAQTTFTMNVGPRTLSQPSITGVQPVILDPAFANDKYFIKGGDFDADAVVTVNGQTTQAIFQDARTLLVTIHASTPSVEIALTNPDNAQAHFTWQRSTLNSGSLVRKSNDYKVYLYDHNYLRHIASARIFSFYPHLATQNVGVVSPDAVQNIPVSTLIRAAGDTKVYEIFPNGKKRWIKTAEEFTSRGFDWNAIFIVNTKELAFYPTTL